MIVADWGYYCNNIWKNRGLL